MEDNYLDTLPHGRDLDAVGGYMYIGESSHILHFWGNLVKNETIFTGVNFDLSGDIENIDHSRRLYIRYDFLHRVMIDYYDPEDRGSAKALSLEEFKKYIGI